MSRPWSHTFYSGYSYVPDLQSPEASCLTEHQRHVVEESRQRSAFYRVTSYLSSFVTPGEGSGLLNAERDAGAGHDCASCGRALQACEHALKSPRGRLAAVALVALAVVACIAGLISHAVRPQAPGGGFVPQGPHSVRHREAGCPPMQPAPAGRRYLQIHNRCAREDGTPCTCYTYSISCMVLTHLPACRCDFKIWPAVLGISGATVPPPEGGWGLESGGCKTLTISAMFPSLRVWGRTGCDEKYNCVTGTCMTDG
jgi:hypothetical protein